MLVHSRYRSKETERGGKRQKEVGRDRKRWGEIKIGGKR